MATTCFRIRNLRQAGPLFRRSFATSLPSRKETTGLKKLYGSAEEAVADIKGDSILLSGGEPRSLLLPLIQADQLMAARLQASGYVVLQTR